MIFRATCLAVLALVAICGCLGSQEIVVGFSGQLTGVSSDLGVQGRNGAQLAVEEVNAAGGVAGKKLRLVAADDGYTPESALAADRELLDAGAVAIVGHMTSAQTMAVLPMLAGREVSLVSPTTATPELAGLKDNFYRVIPESGRWASALADHAARRLRVGGVFVAGDADNAAYTRTFNEAFTAHFQAAGGEVKGREEFSSRAGPDWTALASRVKASGAEAVLLSASARDVAAFAQAASLAGGKPLILCPAWPYTREILLAGGASVDGILFATSYTEDNPTPEFEQFRARYEARFGWPPNFAAAFSHDAVRLLAEALRVTDGSRRGLGEALISLGRIAGVMGPFSLDASGDVDREVFIVTIREGRFVTVNGHGG
ncbi:Leu/Ile/Val-binding protein [Fundidesulfovibrio magnetotacticus]|uniref:Leu/Ile/Val-binding protein n=1 Tax=Fundidesulfovibrio magnetotacticus TaxID=2730080 RepID=A0A6V8LSJ5_9BACT|nr:ABC transporter substrate-binding protein [Fundidesulfovibrio magnetotacticus]GFK93940.1 Leu/Ile/Val-binding protein [Fundidesulfovibrio magnetotacticus]